MIFCKNQLYCFRDVNYKVEHVSDKGFFGLKTGIHVYKISQTSIISVLYRSHCFLHIKRCNTIKDKYFLTFFVCFV